MKNLFVDLNMSTYDLDLTIDDDTNDDCKRFIEADSPQELISLKKKLRGTYSGTIEKKLPTDPSQPLYAFTYSFKDRTPFEIVANLKKLNHVDALLIDVYEKIKTLDAYGQSLLDAGFKKKGTNTKTLAQDLRSAIEEFKLSIAQDDSDVRLKFSTYFTNNHKVVVQKINNLIQNGHKIMGNDRNWSDHIAHFCFALTGIGLLVMVANKLYSGQFFLNNTKRQMQLNDINQEAINLSLKSR